MKLSDKDINPSSKEKKNHSSSSVKILTPSVKHQMEKTKSSTSGELKSDYLKVTHQQLNAKDIDLLLVGNNDYASINEVKTKRVIRESQIDNENRLSSAELQIKVQAAPDQLNVREKIASSKGEKKSLSSTCVNGRSTVIPNRQERDNLIKMQNSSRQKIMHDSLKHGKGNHHDHEAAMLRRLSMEFANQSSLANSLNLNSTRNLFSMIRQLGIPTLFITLSAAETHWKPLLMSLGKLLNKKIYTNEELDEMTWNEKSRLIRSDPVTVARYFDYRVQHFFKTFLLASTSPLGVVEDFFYRIEFQQRGSPHIHGVLWIQNAPKFGTDKVETVEKFISNIISTSTSEPLVNYQRHRHSNYCRKS